MDKGVSSVSEARTERKSSEPKRGVSESQCQIAENPSAKARPSTAPVARPQRGILIRRGELRRDWGFRHDSQRKKRKRVVFQLEPDEQEMQSDFDTASKKVRLADKDKDEKRLDTSRKSDPRNTNKQKARRTVRLKTARRADDRRNKNFKAQVARLNMDEGVNFKRFVGFHWDAESLDKETFSQSSLRSPAEASSGSSEVFSMTYPHFTFNVPSLASLAETFKTLSIKWGSSQRE